jgi:hypothetical protein
MCVAVSCAIVTIATRHLAYAPRCTARGQQPPPQPFSESIASERIGGPNIVINYKERPSLRPTMRP